MKADVRVSISLNPSVFPLRFPVYITKNGIQKRVSLPKTLRAHLQSTLDCAIKNYRLFAAIETEHKYFEFCPKISETILSTVINIPKQVPVNYGDIVILNILGVRPAEKLK